MDITVQVVQLRAIVAVRRAILRPKDPDESWCTYPGDMHPGAVHIRAMCDGESIGIVSIVHDPRIVRGNRMTWRVRGLGVLPTYRGRGIGKRLARQAGRVSIESSMMPIWASARVEHTAMYRSLGGEQVGNEYDIRGTGLHVDFIFRA